MKIKIPFRKSGQLLQRPRKLKLNASVARSRRAPISEEEDFLEEPEPNMRLSHAFVVVLVLHVIAVAGVFAFNSIKARQADIFSATKNEPTHTDAVATSAVPVPSSIDNPTTPEATPVKQTDTPATPIVAAAPAAPIKTYAPVSQSTESTTKPTVNSSKTHELKPGETLTKVASQYGVTVASLQQANKIDDPTKIRAGALLVIPDSAAAIAKSETVTIQPVVTPVDTKPETPKTVTSPVASTHVKESGKIYVVEKGENPVKIAKKLKVSYASLLELNGITDPRKLQIGQKLKIPALADSKP